MRDIEKWAKPRLKLLVHAAAQRISDGLDSAASDGSLGLNDATGDEDDDSYSGGDEDPGDATYEENSADLEEGGGDRSADDEDSQVDENNGDESDEDDSDDDEDNFYREDSTEDESENDDADESEDGGQYNNDQIVRAEDSAIFRLLDGVWYTKEKLVPPLLHDMRNILQYHYSRLCFFQPPEVELLLSFFRIPYLCEKDPSIFGSLFVQLLELGHKTWNRKIFTHMDRMAFFSAQCYLTPLPDSLKIPAATPLFDKPKSAKDFAKRFSSNLSQVSCVQKCYQEAFSFWQTEFDGEYYDGMSSTEPFVAVRNMTTIPRRRLVFSEKFRRVECSHQCYLRLLKRVDRDTEGLYARLAEYYKPIA